MNDRNAPFSFTSMPMNFHLSLQQRLRAAAGVPAYIRRKRRIEDLILAHQEQIAQVEQDALQHGASPQQAETAKLQFAQHLDLQPLNDLIDRHNRYYPIEANLPHCVRTGHIMMCGKPWIPLEKITWKDLL